MDIINTKYSVFLYSIMQHNDSSYYY